jgi:nuclear transport factor 2 (NTF2) superfamily protein
MAESARLFRWAWAEAGRRPDEHPALSALGL